jgi:anti-anti-sigma factor
VLRLKTQMLWGDEKTEAIFERAFAVVDNDKRANVALNFDGVDFFASVAIGKLVKLMRKVKSAGGQLVVCKLNRPLESMLQVTHLADIIPVYNDEQEAVRSLGR